MAHFSTTAVEPKTVNGVDVERLEATVSAIQADPTIARFVFRASNRWLRGGHNRTVIKDFYGAGKEDTSRAKEFVLDNDEPDVLLGADKGANPVEFVLHALAGCLTTSLVYHAAARNIHIQEVATTFEGDLDLRGFLGLSEEVRNGYEGITVTMMIKADASKEVLEELCELAQQRSPVFDIVTNPVPVSVRLAR